jgi:outer membrane protein assembly factor BamB
MRPDLSRFRGKGAQRSSHFDRARTTPLAILASIVAAAVCLRVRHPAVTEAPRKPRASLASSPSAKPESLPVAAIAPKDAPVQAGPPRMLHGDAHHTHRAEGHVAKGSDVLWTFHADGPIEGQVVASPDAATLYVATLGGTLWALDRGGRPRFHVPLGARAYGTPCVAADGTVYVGSDGGAFFAIGPGGRVEWRLETTGDADTGAVITDGGLVVFAAGDHVYGVRPGGVLAFRFHTKGKAFTAPALSATAAGDVRILVGSQDDHVYALTTQGELDWSTDLGHDVDGAPAVADDGAIFVGTDGDEVVSLGGDGHIAWRAAVGGHLRGTLSIARNGDVLAGVYGPSPRVVRLSSRGVLLGAFPVRGHGTAETGVYGGPLEDDDGTLVFGGQDGVVHVVDATGLERWAYDAHADVDAPVTLLPDGSLVVGDYAGDVIALGVAGELPRAPDGAGAR